MKYWAIYRTSDIIVEELHHGPKSKVVYIPYTPLFATKTQAKMYSKRFVEPYIEEGDYIEFRLVTLEEEHGK